MKVAEHFFCKERYLELQKRKMKKQVLSIFVKGNHQGASYCRFHHSRTHALEKSRYSLFLLCTIHFHSYLVYTAHDAEGRQRLSRSHLLLCLHNVKRIHQEGRQRSRSRSADEALRRARNVQRLHQRTYSLQSTWLPPPRTDISQCSAEKEMSRSRFV